MGRSFYFSQSEGNDGRTVTQAQDPSTPWQSIAKFNSTTWLPGDHIYFKRGDQWWGSPTIYIEDGSVGDPIIVDSYGVGDLPLIASATRCESGWADQGGNIWRHAITDYVGNLILNLTGTKVYGTMRATQGECVSAGDFYSDGTTYLYVYSGGDPALMWSDGIAACLEQHAVNLTGASYVTFQNIALGYAGVHGFYITTSDHVKIDHVRVTHCGGGKPTNKLGNGIEVWQDNNNIEISWCLVEEVFDEGITIQDDTVGATTVSDISVHHNVVVNCNMGISWYTYGPGSSSTRVVIAHNIIYNANGGWASFWTNHPAAYYCGGNADTSTFTDCKVVNNIFHIAATYANPFMYWKMTVGGRYTNIPAGIVCDYNCYMGATGDDLFWTASTNTGTKYTFAQWKDLAGVGTNEDHSLTDDPVFVALGTDWHLQGTSPCKTAGLDIGWGNYIGLYEYVDALPTVSNLSVHQSEITGGVAVTITGTNFTDVTGVTFGGTAATAYTVDSSTQIRATAPPHAAGTVQVQVTTSEGSSANTAADDFTYFEAGLVGVFEFNGTRFAQSGNLAMTLNHDFSVFIALYPSGTTGCVFFFGNPLTDADYYSVVYNGAGKLAIKVGTLSSDLTVTATKWTLLHFKRSGSTLTLKNVVTGSQVTKASPAPTGTPKMAIGKYIGSTPGQLADAGKLSGLAVYTDDVSAVEEKRNLKAYRAGLFPRGIEI